MSRVYEPLAADHPAVGQHCGICHKEFQASERTTILTSDVPNTGTLAGVLAHARCALAGARFDQGEIETIKDGDASPYPVVMTNGKQYKLEELGLA